MALGAVDLHRELDFVANERLVALRVVAHLDVADLSRHLHLAEDGHLEGDRGVALGGRRGRAHLAVLADLRGRLHDTAVPIGRRGEDQALGHGGGHPQRPVGELISVQRRLERGSRLLGQLLLALAPPVCAFQLVDLGSLLADGLVGQPQHERVEIHHRLLLLEQLDGDHQADEQVSGDLGQTVQLVLCQDCPLFQLRDLLRFRSHENCLL